MAVVEERILPNRNVRFGMFGLGMVVREICLTRIGLVPGNVVMVAIDMYGKSLRE